MNNPLTINIRAARRVLYVMVAAMLVVAGLPLFAGKASAAIQLASRSIQLSDSAPSASSIVSGVGSGTSVAYQVTFTNVSEASSLVIDFCSNDPIVGDSCTAPTGMDASATALNATAFSGKVQTTTNNWAVTATASQVKLADDNTGGGSGGPHPTHDIQATSTQSFQLTGITNPSTVGTFYARIYTYSDNNWSDGTTAYSSPTSIGADEEYGGIALSTAAVIQITARVQESLTFCISSLKPDNWNTTGPTTGLCSDAAVALNPPVITIGHIVGSGPPILDSTQVDTTPVYTQLSTNATHGAIVNLRDSNTACTYTGMPGGFPGGGLSADNGTTCQIPPVDDGANTGGVLMSAGTAAFGLNVAAYTPGSNIPPNQSGAVGPTAEYSPANHYGMDTTTNTGSAPFPGSNGNASSTYGSTVATTAGPVYAADDEDTFAAAASLTTPAGIYTANLVEIATGTF